MLDLLLSDSKSIWDGIEEFSKVVDRVDPSERARSIRFLQLAILCHWIVEVQQATIMRQHDFEHVLLHLLYNTDQPIRGKRLKELQALLGEHGVRLLSLEEELHAVHGRLGDVVSDFSQRLRNGPTFEGNNQGEG